MKTLITGANGFIGAALREKLRAEPGHHVVSVTRRPDAAAGTGDYVLDLCEEQLPEGSLAGVDAVVHAAARVHVMRDQAADPLSECRRTNRDVTLRLARQAANEGVKRFVFISTAKVHGEETGPGQVFSELDVPAPADPYAISKLEAETELLELGAREGLEVVIVRPPLVYGPGVRANFQTMMRWVRRGIPLPLGAVHNQRSLVGLENLVDLIGVCVRHPAAANEVFLASDGEDVSTTQLLRLLAQAMHRPARLLPVPVSVMQAMGKLAGKEPVLRRLCSNFQVSADKAQKLLGWQPPMSLEQGLALTVSTFLENE